MKKENIIFKPKFNHTFHTTILKHLKKEVLRPKWLILAHVYPVQYKVRYEYQRLANTRGCGTYRRDYGHLRYRRPTNTTLTMTDTTFNNVLQEYKKANEGEVAPWGGLSHSGGHYVARMPPAHDMENERQDKAMGNNLERLHADESSSVVRDQWRPRISNHDVARDDPICTHLHHKRTVGIRPGNPTCCSPNSVKRKRR